MAKVTNGEGEEIEAFTQEEVDAKLKETEDKFRGQVKEKDANLTRLAAEKVVLEEQVKNVKPDHPNFAALKTALKSKEDETVALKETIEADKKVRAQEAIQAEIKSLAKGNVEMEKKIKLQLDTTLKGMPETTPEEKSVKMAAAVKLSVDFSNSKERGIFDGGISSGGQGSGVGAGEGAATVEFSAKERELGAKLGLSAEDYKKYGSKVSKK